ncbi:hypothetical protein NM688_g943 [Phlebia brevispora]|uniref:Uncharacterized protein n=1 Tax=Phlebia brevispora TaxID=194682 RepID=A0ACC1TD98_9APHY|nr:hypothetical protein NM688_g943 [Phlebia brevispora]
MSSPASLRDLYAPPSSAWSFAPAAPNGSVPDIHPPASSSSYQWTTRTSSNPLFGLSSTLATREDEPGFDITVVLQGFIAHALLQYAATAVAIPWEVGKTLLQVQWVPRNAEDMLPVVIPTPIEHEQEEEDEETDSSNENENDSYFADPRALDANADSSSPPRPSDERGYIIRQSVLEEGTIPEYVIPVGSAAGTWGMMKRLGRFRPEGLLSLWKGLLTSSVMEMTAAGLQPAIHTLLESMLSAISPALFAAPPILIPVASQVVTGFIISPLDLVRTRLIVQSAVPRYRTYSGPIDALKQILEHEGGLSGIYFHPHLFLPTIIDCTLRSLVPFTIPTLISSYLSISADSNPLLWTCAELLGTCAGLLITLPFETVRRRLQVQVRGTAKPLKACVELRPAPYNGMVDAFWHILTEERSDLPLKHRRHRRRSVNTKGKTAEETQEGHDGAQSESWWRSTGIGQLYRGLGMRLGASVIVLVLAMVNGGEEPDAGWAEL